MEYYCHYEFSRRYSLTRFLETHLVLTVIRRLENPLQHHCRFILLFLQCRGCCDLA
jgi:hypothetical protein